MNNRREFALRMQAAGRRKAQQIQRAETRKKKAKKSSPNTHVKAREAREAMQRKSVTSMTTITPTRLAKLSDAQLTELAAHIGRQYDETRAEAIAEAKRTPYHALPIVRPTKQDYARAYMPVPTAEEIAAAPSKQRRFMRRRVRKAREAQRKIYQYIIAKAQPQQSVYERRVAELNRTARGTGGVAPVGPSRLTDFIQRTNILGDTPFVRILADERRDVLEAEILDAAKILGKKTSVKPSKKRPSKKSQKTIKRHIEKMKVYGENEEKRYRAFEHAIEVTMGRKGLRKWQSLTAKQKRQLWKEGAIIGTVWNWTEYKPDDTTYSPIFKTKKQRSFAHETFNDYITMAKQEY